MVALSCVEEAEGDDGYHHRVEVGRWKVTGGSSSWTVLHHYEAHALLLYIVLPGLVEGIDNLQESSKLEYPSPAKAALRQVPPNETTDVAGEMTSSEGIYAMRISLL